MSWQIFKDNIMRMSDNPDAIADIDTVARTYAREYDAAIKRGKDTIEGISLQKGNVEIMEALFKAALQKGLTTQPPYDLVGEMGKGVIAYWSGAIMNNFPNPKTLPPGAVSNISVTSNIVMDPGQWQPPTLEEIAAFSDSAEADAIKKDIDEEYPKNQQIYEAQFDSEQAAMENNSNILPEEALSSVAQFEEEKAKININEEEIVIDVPVDEGVAYTRVSGSSAPLNDTELKQVKKFSVAKGDKALFDICGGGEWPAVGSAPNFTVIKTQSAGGCPRYWYKENVKYMVKNCTEIMFPTANGDVKIMVHKNLAAIVKPALAKIKAQGLQSYIKDCGGGLAIRNVTCGDRLSNHSWGTAIDMNIQIYPYGYKFVTTGDKPGIYQKQKKPNPDKFIRAFNDFDKGFLQVVAIFKAQGMTWLSNNDPMHVSIYE